MPKLKDEKKIAAIHQAAMDLVIQTGFIGLKMADVAKRAGLATGTLYVYYKSKDQLINEIFVATKKEIANTLLSESNFSENFYETVKNMWMSYLNFCLNQSQKMLFVEQFFYSGYISVASKTEAEQLLEPLNEFLRASQSKRLIRSIDIEFIKAQLNGPIHEIVKMVNQTHILLDSQTIEQCFDMAWNSIRQ